jgi:TatD DNase family protein
MIDSHCHVTDPRLRQQLPEVLARAAANGVDRVATIGTDLEDDAACIELCRTNSNVRCVIGVHPNYCADVSLEQLDALRDLQADPSVVALGEMGLDYFHNNAPRDHQKKIFERELEIAAEFNRPVVIHSREAIDDTLAIMRAFPTIRAVFHCFTGTPEEAKKIVAAGYLVGFTGAVTFKKNDALRTACGLVPLDRLLVETDGPYMSPEPMRSQKINEPSLVVHVARVVASVKGVPYPEIDAITTENTKRFYNWP